jgi:hypothetical protein
VLDLTPEQWNWLKRPASARSAALPDVLGTLVDDARLTDDAARRRANAERA